MNIRNNADAASHAFDLWQACNEERDKRIKILAYRAVAGAKQLAEQLVEQDIISQPKRYPVTYQEFLKLLVGGRSKPHREKIYRDYVKEQIWMSHVFQLAYPKNQAEKIPTEEAVKTAKSASLDEIDFWMKDAKQRVYQTEEQYRHAARQFIEWRAKQPSALGRKAANARWSKNRQEKQAFKELY